jgi:hypothetical protein
MFGGTRPSIGVKRSTWAVKQMTIIAIVIADI